MKKLIGALLCLLLVFSFAYGDESTDSAGFVVVDEEDEDFVEFPVIEPVMEVTITFGGDAVLGTREAWWDEEDALPAYLIANGMSYPFSGLEHIFREDDMTMINLECVLKDTRSGEMTTKQYRFRGLPEYTEILTSSSIEQVNIANNHHIDYRLAGRDATRTALEAAGIPYSGYTYTYVWQHRGVRIGFAGCRETIWKQNRQIISEEADALRAAGCDVIIYSCHWGTEYSPYHNEIQMEMAQAAAKAGVDILIGTHPHVVQGLDDVDGTVVLWSLGNLMFGGTIEMSTFDATLARFTLCFQQHRYVGCRVELIPILTSGKAHEGVNDYHPVPAEGDDYSRILMKIQQDSGVTLQKEMFFPAR